MVTDAASRFEPIPLTINVVEDRDSLLVELVGELDIATVKSLQHLLSDDLERFTKRQVAFDLCGLSLIDSRGIALLSAVCEQVRDAGGSFSVKSEGWVRNVLQVAGILDLINLEERLARPDRPR
jgi:anti-anti-sigma factor